MELVLSNHKCIRGNAGEYAISSGTLGQADWTFGIRSIGNCLRILPILHPDEYCR